MNYSDDIKSALSASTEAEVKAIVARMPPAYKTGDLSIFDLLWKAVLREPWEGLRPAVRLLVKMYPDPTRCVDELLAEMLDSQWDVRNRLPPLYLVSHFGLQEVLASIAALRRAGRDRARQERLTDIERCAKMPAQAWYANWDDV